MSDSVEATLAQQVQYYRARAAEYDEWWFRRGRYDHGADLNALWFAEAAEVESAVDACGLRGRILELAGGTGIWSQKLLRYADQLTILDASAEVLAVNEARLRSERVRYIQADLFDWRPSEHFDVVFFGFWLSHVPESRFEAFWELVRASLAPQGRVLFIDSQREPTSTASDQLLSDTSITLRRLNDGRTFPIYKIFYDPVDLQGRLERLGWNATVRTTSRYFLYGSCSSADAGAGMAKIERAAARDVPTIKDVLRETWHDTYASLLPKAAIEDITSRWHAPELLTEQIRNPEIYFAVARDGAVVAGVITARKQDDAIVVDRLYVLPQYQRRGIGRQLLESSYGRFRGARRVRLTVEAENRKGVSFYAKEGFRETSRIFEEVAGARLENVVMERPL